MGKACRVLEFAEGLLGLDPGREGEDEFVSIGEGIGRGVADAEDRGAEGAREVVSATGSTTAGEAMIGAASIGAGDATGMIAGGGTPHPEAAGVALAGREETGTTGAIGALAGRMTGST